MNPRIVVILASILVVAAVWFDVAMSGSNRLPATGTRPTISIPAPSSSPLPPNAPEAGPAGSAGLRGSATRPGANSADQEDISEGDAEDEAKPSNSPLLIGRSAVPVRIVPSPTPFPIPLPSPPPIP